MNGKKEEALNATNLKQASARHRAGMMLEEDGSWIGSTKEWRISKINEKLMDTAEDLFWEKEKMNQFENDVASVEFLLRYFLNGDDLTKEQRIIDEFYSLLLNIQDKMEKQKEEIRLLKANF